MFILQRALFGKESRTRTDVCREDQTKHGQEEPAR